MGSHSKQFSIKLIYEMIENEDIDLNPEIQRHFVWNSKQKSRLIESILLRTHDPQKTNLLVGCIMAKR
jgi:uncharacterized protein with ParB-like and HNH nuclease domain